MRFRTIRVCSIKIGSNQFFMKKQNSRLFLAHLILAFILVGSAQETQAQFKFWKFKYAFQKPRQSCIFPPIINCPPNFNACPGVSTSPNNTGTATASPGGLGCNQPVVTHQDQILSQGPCTNAIEIKRTWTATDPQDPSLTSSCFQIIKLADNTAPVITNCPKDITMAANINCFATVFWNPPTVTDNCGKLFLTVSHISGDNFPIGVTRVTYTAEDLCGNSSTCAFNITITGNCCSLPPTISCPPDYNGCPGDTILPKKTGTPITFPGSPTCGTPILTYRDSSLSSGPCNGALSFYRYWTARDPNDSTLKATCRQKITLKDEQAPILSNCPPNITVAPTSNCQANVSWTNPSLSDNCTGASLSSSHANGSLFNEGTSTVVITATDRCGNTSSCSFTVTVSACCNVPPVISCPVSYRSCPGTSIDPSVTGMATASPGAPQCGTPTITYSDQIVSTGPCNGAIQITRKWKATDPNNSTLFSTCDQTIVLSDIQRPSITNCPQNITVTADPSSCIASVSWTDPILTDNCGTPTLYSSHSNPGTYLEGITTVTLRATDACGNTATCSFTITVLPCCNTAPVINCPANYTGCPSSSTNPATTGTATASPGAPQCGIPTITYSDRIISTGPCQGAIEIERTWKATDPNRTNLSSSCIQTIKLIDQTPPVFTSCPSNVTIQPNQNCQAIYNWVPPTATDNCGQVNLSSTHQPGATFNVGTTIVTYTATDGCGNAAQHSFTVTVPNTCCNQPPILTCPPPYTGCPAQSYGPNFTGMASATKSSPACSTPEITYRDSILSSGPCANAKKLIRIWKAADPNYPHLFSICHQSIELKDNVPPMFTSCPGNFQVDLQGACEKAIYWPVPTATDNCGAVSITSNLQPGVVLGAGSYRIVYTVYDACGNASIHSFYINVIGGGLELTCPADITVNRTDPNLNGAYVNYAPPSLSACGGVCSDSLPGFMYVGTFNGHKYFCSLQPNTWENAKAICRSVGGDLISINSAAENAFITSKIMGATAWIGLNDVRSEGVYEWSDGSPLNYTNWYPGQPNNANGDQDHCEILPDGTWNDQYPNCTREFICEIPCQDVRLISGLPSGSLFPCGTTIVKYVAYKGSLTDTCSFTVTVNCNNNNNGNYCTSKGLDSRYMWIQNVSFSNLNNTSGNNGGYGNFTNMCANVAWGKTYNICLTPGYASNVYIVYWRIWIDYNGDGDFEDANEFVAYGNGSSRLCGTITLPGSCACPPKVTRMRIAMSYGGYAGNSCCIFQYGEVEDYCVNITSTFGSGGQNQLTQELDPVKLNCDGCAADQMAFDANEIESKEIPAIVAAPQEAAQLLISPNPASQLLDIKADHFEVDHLSIYNSLGVRVWDSGRGRNSHQFSIDVSQWADGNYIVQSVSTAGVTQSKILQIKH